MGQSPVGPRANLLLRARSTQLGLGFLFVTVFALGLVLVGLGAISLATALQSQSRSNAALTAATVATIEDARSNEKANPAAIAFYLGDAFAGAIHEDGTYASAEQPPSNGGALAVLFLNPTNTALPTTVRYQAQSITLKTDATTMTICVPSVDGGTSLWVDRAGSTFRNPGLTTLARRC